MRLAFALQVLSNVRKVGADTCILMGGEPTLYPNLLEVIGGAKKLGFKVALITNGIRLAQGEQAALLFKAGLTKATISFHGWSAFSYSQAGNCAAMFSKAVDGYHNLQNAGIHATANIVLSSLSLGRGDEICDFLIKNRIKRVVFNVATPAVSKAAVVGTFTPPPQEAARQVVEVFDKCCRHRIQALFALNLPFCLFAKDDIDCLLRRGVVQQGCHVRYGGGLVIRSDGVPTICTHLLDWPILEPSRVADIFRSSRAFISWWRSEELISIRKAASRAPLRECEQCEWWMQCGGGCMLHWSYHDPMQIKMNMDKCGGLRTEISSRKEQNDLTIC